MEPVEFENRMVNHYSTGLMGGEMGVGISSIEII